MTDEAPVEATVTAPPVAAVPIDQDELTVTELAQAVLSREIRPRVTSIRRLAQAVVDSGGESPKKKKGKSVKKDGKKRKLARIAGQKSKKG